MKNKLILAGVVLILLPACDQLKDLVTNPEPSPVPSPSVPVSGNPSPMPSSTPGPLCPAYAPDNDKYMQAGYYGEGADVSAKVRNRNYCETLWGVSGPYDCNANVNGDFPGCDVEFLNGLQCPQWFYQDPEFGFWLRCDSRPNQVASCDKFDHWVEGSGKYTGPCNVNQEGNPVTGWFVVPHGNTSFKACDKTGKICSNPLRFNK